MTEEKDSTPPADESQSSTQDQAPAADDKPTAATDAAAATDPTDAAAATDPTDAAAATDAADAGDVKASTPAKAPKKTSKPRRKPKVAAKADAAPTAKEDKPVKPSVAPGPSGAPSDGHWWWGTGRRKRAVARVRIRPGDGKFVVNKRPHDSYFTEERDRNDLMNVLNKTNTAGSLDVYVNLHGGGYMGQAGAIVLGLGRALRKYDETLEPILRSNGFLSRDPRKVERKKYGQRGARRRFQFSKR